MSKCGRRNRDNSAIVCNRKTGHPGDHAANGLTWERGATMPVETLRETIAKIRAGADPLNPDYYKRNGVECIQITEDMSFCLGNAVKYLFRAGAKNPPIEDLKKAIWYIEREIARLERDGVG